MFAQSTAEENNCRSRALGRYDGAVAETRQRLEEATASPATKASASRAIGIFIEVDRRDEAGALHAPDEGRRSGGPGDDARRPGRARAGDADLAVGVAQPFMTTGRVTPRAAPIRAAAAAMRSTPPRLPAPRPATTRNVASSRSPVRGGSSASSSRRPCSGDNFDPWRPVRAEMGIRRLAVGVGRACVEHQAPGTLLELERARRGGCRRRPHGRSGSSPPARRRALQ